MTIEQWNNLRLVNREKLIDTVFNNQYLSATHAFKDPSTDPVIKEVIDCTTINGDTAYINIHKTVKLK